MKKLMLSCMALLILAASVQAQEDPAKALKKAGTALKTFSLDQSANLDKLHEAVQMIAIAEEGDATKGLVETWQTSGDIYNAIASQIVSIRQYNIGSESDLPKVDQPAVKAFTAYQQAMTLAEKNTKPKAP
ncbi:MAG: hypothetical protein R2795_01695 [Saprospiraceae bacterium]